MKLHLYDCHFLIIMIICTLKYSFRHVDEQKYELTIFMKRDRFIV